MDAPHVWDHIKKGKAKIEKKTLNMRTFYLSVVLIVGTEVSVVAKAIGASWRRMYLLAYRNILEIFLMESNNVMSVLYVS